MKTYLNYYSLIKNLQQKILTYKQSLDTLTHQTTQYQNDIHYYERIMVFINLQFQYTEENVFKAYRFSKQTGGVSFLFTIPKKNQLVPDFQMNLEDQEFVNRHIPSWEKARIIKKRIQVIGEQLSVVELVKKEVQQKLQHAQSQLKNYLKRLKLDYQINTKKIR